MKGIKCAAVASFTLLTGCANNVWVKPGASQTDFTQARYACLQQSQQGASSAYVNRTYGVASSGVVTNDGLFSACMNAAGWNLQNQNAAQVQQSQNQTKFNSGLSRLNQIKEETNDVCRDPAYQSYYAKSPCLADQATLQQMTDKSKITASEKEALDAATRKQDQLNEEAFIIVRKGSPRDQQFANYYDQFSKPQFLKIRLDLYDAKITWGEYNRKRKEINDAFRVEQKRIYAK